MNWKALLAVTTLVLLIYFPTWGPAVTQSLRPSVGNPTTKSTPVEQKKVRLDDDAPAHSIAARK